MKYLLLLFSIVTWSQQFPRVDFIRCTSVIAPNFEQKNVVGNVVYHFKVMQPTDTIRIDAKSMQFSNLKINNLAVRFKQTQSELLLYEGFKKGMNRVSFSYTASPKQTMYFVGQGATRQIWTQGQGKYTSHWMPSFDDVNEKVIFNLQIISPKDFVAIANGVLKKTTVEDSQHKVWYYEMQKPMSSYLLALVIGDFRNKVIASKSGIPLQFFIQPKDTTKFEATYRHSLKIFDYLQQEIGYKYPWQLYKQIPVEDFLYAGMENTSCTIFAQDYVVDDIGFNDRNYVNVNAHELAHQWFGDVVTAKSGKHHWLQEGFATYYALLAERAIFGDDYFYHQLYRTSLQLRNAAKTDTIPVLHEKASSLSFYQKGAWALHSIREAIGPKLFQKAVKAYLKKHQFKNVTTDDFLMEIQKVAPAFDTDAFQKQWLLDYHFPTEEATALLKKNAFIRTLLETQQLRKNSVSDNQTTFIRLLQSDVFYPVKTEIVYQLREVPFVDKEALVTIAMQTKDVKVRQAVAEFTETIPASFQAEYETLLDDASYETREIAFLKLWKNFPEQRSRYLEKAKHWIGGNDKGLRILYLTFAWYHDDKPSDKESIFSELVRYTHSNYESSVRQNALTNALAINPNDTTALKNLVNATIHHKWQFSKFGREKIRQLLQNEAMATTFQALLPTLPENEAAVLQKLLNEKS